jgi:DNA repair protein SbcC/Rad50
LAEMDIVNTLQKIYGVLVPVFLDNAERLSSNSYEEVLSAMNCQLVTLAVSEDAELRVKVGECH